MSEQQCKAAVCGGECLNEMITPRFFQVTAYVVIPLAVNGLLTDDQLDKIIAIYEHFGSTSFTHAEQEEFEERAVEKIKEIIL